MSSKNPYYRPCVTAKQLAFLSQLTAFLLPPRLLDERSLAIYFIGFSLCLYTFLNIMIKTIVSLKLCIRLFNRCSKFETLASHGYTEYVPHPDAGTQPRSASGTEFHFDHGDHGGARLLPSRARFRPYLH